MINNKLRFNNQNNLMSIISIFTNYMDETILTDLEIQSEGTNLKISIIRLFSDESGKSHFGSLDIETAFADFAPPAPKVLLSKPTVPKQNFFLALPPRWFGDFHPVPSRQIMTLVSGSLEVIVSDGEKRVFVPGNTALVEDILGEGHITRNVSDEVAILSVIQI